MKAVLQSLCGLFLSADGLKLSELEITGQGVTSCTMMAESRDLGIPVSEEHRIARNHRQWLGCVLWQAGDHQGAGNHEAAQ